MIQFFRINNFKVDELKDKGFVEQKKDDFSEEFHFISDLGALWFFFKRLVYFAIIIYGTLFLAVSIPYFKLPFIPAYFVGSMIGGFFICRLFNHFIKYFQYRKGRIVIESSDYVMESPLHEGDESEKNELEEDYEEDVELTKGPIENDIVVVDDLPSYIRKIRVFSRKEIIIPAQGITYMEHNILGNLIIREKYFQTSIPIMLLPENQRHSFLAHFQEMAPKRASWYRKAWEFFDAVIVALLLAVHVIQFVLQAYYIPSPSMEDTLREGDQLFVEKITYGPSFPRLLHMKKPIRMNFLGLRSVERKDIVIFNPPHEKDKDYIKRCIALSGDRIDIRNGSVYINSKKLNEPYTKGVTIDDKRVSKIQGIVPQGKIVVMGDNRENSQDSRFFGYLDKSRIKGRAFVLYFNWHEVKKLNFTRLGLIR